MLPQLLLPLLLAESIRATIASDTTLLPYYFAGYALILAANVPLHLLFIRLVSRRVRAMELGLRAALATHFQRLSFAFLDRVESGRLQTKVLRDVDRLTKFSNDFFQGTLGAFLSLLFALTYTLSREPWIALAYLIVGPISVFVIERFYRVMRQRDDALRGEMEFTGQRISEMIAMLTLTRSHGIEEQALRRVRTPLRRVQTRGRRVDQVNALFGSLSFVTLNAAILVLLATSAYAAVHGWVGVEKIALYTSLFQMVVGSIMELSQLLPEVSSTSASIRSIAEILQSPELEPRASRPPPDPVAGSLRFENVSFSYPNSTRSAVHEVSLEIKPGEVLALVGESGGGKTTLLNLAIGLLQPTSGQVFIDDIPLADLDLPAFRRNVAVVPQHTVLFSGTLRENVACGLDHLTDSDILSALHAARLDEVVSSLPQGLSTPIGENGLRLSGGQRQRLAIARAILRDPRIVFLDEATSALDSESEAEVQRALATLLKGRTTLVVAHRLASIRHATRVVVLSAGRVIECGPPSVLAAQGGPFSRLLALQSLA
jgi:ATP-binding cassette subfamily B protein